MTVPAAFNLAAADVVVVLVVEVVDVVAVEAAAGVALTGVAAVGVDGGVEEPAPGPLRSEPAPELPPESDELVLVVVPAVVGPAAGPPISAMIRRPTSAALVPSATGPMAIPISTPQASIPVARMALRRPPGSRTMPVRPRKRRLRTSGPRDGALGGVG
jgi:hypothetical protein